MTAANAETKQTRGPELSRSARHSSIEYWSPCLQIDNNSSMTNRTQPDHLSSGDWFHTLLHDGLSQCNAAGKGLLLAVSGGADSVALLHGAVAQLVGRAQSIHVAHVNHHMRGAESDADAEFVRDLADSIGLPFHLLDADVMASHAASGGGSVEATARRLRYELLAETALQHKLDAIVTAHHRDDQAETVLHNLLRGTGLRGLSGMNAIRTLSNGCQLLRPMLQITHDDVLRYLAESGRAFRTDGSNLDRTILRNRIRNELLPTLTADYNKQAAEHLAAAGDHARDAVECLDELAGRLLAESLLEETLQICRLSLPAVNAWPAFLVRHAMSLLWTRCNWPRRDMTAEHWNAIGAALTSGRTSSVSFPGGVQLTVQRDIARFERAQR